MLKSPYLLIMFLFLGSSVFTQILPEKEESNLTAFLDKAKEKLDSGDTVAAGGFLQQASDLIGVKTSSENLYGYYQTLGSLNFERYLISEAISAYKLSIPQAEKLKDTVKMIAAHSGMCNALLMDKKFKQAIVHHTIALKMAEVNKGYIYYGLLSNIAVGYSQARDYQKALESLLEVKKHFQEEQKLDALAIVENNIGELYRNNFKDYRLAQKHYHLAAKINKNNKNLRQLKQNHHNLAVLFTETHQLDSAYHYIHSAIILQNELNDVGGAAISNNALGNIQLEDDKHVEAIESFQKTIEISNSYGITPGLYYGNLGVGKALLAMGKRDEALKYFLKVRKISKGMDSFDLISDITKKLVEIHKENRNFEEAFSLNEELQKMEDSISAFNHNEKLDELRIQYESQLSKTENNVLKETETRHEELIKIQNIMLLILGIVVIIILVLALFLYKAYLHRKESLKELTIVNEKLEKQYKTVKEHETELKRNVELKDMIFSVLGHDLRTPLANISNMLDNISQIELNKEETTYILKHLKGETTASLKTLENILQWARLQMKDHSLNLMELDEDAIIIEILKDFEAITDTKNIDVKYVNKSNSLLWADENQFRSIVKNLVANAVKFSPVGGEIIILFNEEREDFVFCVSDQGVGISPSVIENLTTRQKLMSTYGTEGEKGTGIGLWIVNEFVNMHKGKIEFLSNEPFGTIVKIHFPKLVKNEVN